ncbi:MAG: type B 50S ribosomal protein L31 [Actinomycetia bacterium]|nr:type B 50S ribosomal protein L31 [Actinomycetes bacterium]MCP4087170.1 type B 50S ribosomal protein L31 [Actinomycetes bacterium]
MREGIHPEYRLVVFEDTGAGARFITRSSVATSDTTEHEGETYPLYKVEISSASHPFFTGKMKIVDTAGRVERFERRYGRRKRSGAEAEAGAENATD